MKKSITNNYILVDLGNTCIKACVYNKQTQKISNCLIDKNKVDFKKVITKLNIKKVDKIIYLSSSNQQLQNRVLKQINNYCRHIQFVNRKILSKLVDLSNIKKDVVIGNDILLGLYHLSRKYNKAACLVLGTVYYLLVTNKKQLKTVHLIPNIAAGLKTISKKTSIPNNLIPKIFDKDIGLNTPDAFASGAKAIIDGYLEFVSKKFNIPKNKIFITGGDTFRFKSLAKKYQFVCFGSLKALACLTKEKKW